ncbi:MAG: hypothetical protein FWE95_03010 [Planctomycetaceae bacterium]|nr:hypothetical protein [Planctomycetaceae bacterium]
MRKNFPVVSAIFAFAALILFACTTAAAEWNVGAGYQYTTLDALRQSGRVVADDIIILHGDDNSLRGQFTVANLTFQGTGKISPAPNAPSPTRLSNGGVTLNSNDSGLELSGFAPVGGGAGQD